MIDLSPEAAEKLTAVRDEESVDALVRLYVAGRTCCGARYGLAFVDEAEPTDTVHEVGGVKFAVDPASRPYCEDVAINYVETTDGAGFSVRGPRRNSSCACGAND